MVVLVENFLSQWSIVNSEMSEAISVDGASYVSNVNDAFW